MSQSFHGNRQGYSQPQIAQSDQRTVEQRKLARQVKALTRQSDEQLSLIQKIKATIDLPKHILHEIEANYPEEKKDEKMSTHVPLATSQPSHPLPSTIIGASTHLPQTMKFIPSNGDLPSVLSFSFPGESGHIITATTSPDTSFLAASSINSSVLFWQMPPPGAVRMPVMPQIRFGHSKPPFYLHISHDASVLLSASVDGSLRVWPLHESQSSPVVFYPSLLHTPITAATATPTFKNYTLIATGGADGQVTMFHLQPGSKSLVPLQRRSEFRPHTGPVTAVTIAHTSQGAADSFIVVSGDSNGSVMVTLEKEINVAERSVPILRALGSAVCALDVWVNLHQHISVLAVGLRDGRLMIYFVQADLHREQPLLIASFQLPEEPTTGRPARIQSLDFSPCGALLACQLWSGELMVLDVSRITVRFTTALPSHLEPYLARYREEAGDTKRVPVQELADCLCAAHLVFPAGSGQALDAIWSRQGDIHVFTTRQ
eukprot:gnl/Dysnectes_brevis/2475_a2958_1020.p1 GENE.gnl/Dysnectes_brevis/2475_a2958_1020~~gnl/Dysnectes_brevis/2475_a2958_1020.p1  ORF type:complete len:488 (-),score=113.94 gnl/Dysnectes_brevis/2475_a2958_1020:62-1525(-)